MSWTEVALGVWAPLTYGKALPEPSREPGYVPVYSSAGITGRHSKALVSAPAVIVGRKGNVGTVFYSDSPSFPIDTAFYTHGSPDAHLRFVAYKLESMHLGQHTRDSAVPGLRRDDYSALRTSVPPLYEQQAIAEVLGALDDKIAVNAKVAEAIDDALAVAFKSAMAAGTEEHALLDVVGITFGEAFKGAQFSEPGVGRPLIRIRDLRSQKLQVWTTEVRPRETIIRAGDIVIGMDAEFRATAWLGIDGLLNQRVCRATSSLMSNALLREALREPLAAIENQKSATTVIHLNKSDLARTSIRIPTSEWRETFRSRYDAAYDLRVNAAAESERLAALRDALLPELMSGRLRVKDAERAVEEAV